MSEDHVTFMIYSIVRLVWLTDCMVLTNFNIISVISRPIRLAHWWPCLRHDLVVVSSISSWNKLSFRRIFASHLCQRKVVGGLERKLCQYWCEKARKHMCVNDLHDTTLAVNTTNQLVISRRSVIQSMFFQNLFLPVPCMISFARHWMFSPHKHLQNREWSEVRVEWSMIAIATGFIIFSLTSDRCFDYGYMGKQPLAWKESCAVHG